MWRRGVHLPRRSRRVLVAWRSGKSVVDGA
jgi:hypothetical protein